MGLVLFLLFTRRGGSDLEDFSAFEQGQLATAQKPVAVLPEAQATVQPAQAEPMATQAAPTDAYASPVEAPAPVNTGPPLPATGLPEGWNMEQWNYYGAQWLEANQPAPAPVQPIVSQTPPATGTPEL